MKKKAKKLLGCGCLGVLIILILLVLFILWLFPLPPSSPDDISRKAGWKIPEYTLIQSDDNLDRSSSSWDSFQYVVRLNEPLTDKQLKKLDKKVAKDGYWNLSDGHYVYKYPDGRGEWYRSEIYVDVIIDPETGTVRLQLEQEGL